MSSPENKNDQPQPTESDLPYTPHQRPGKPGVDYDEYGEEMAPGARIWKKYVEETDRADKELVGGWNRLLDIILIFAALFSAISTAFVIESSKDLKPDHAETSAQTLQLISQILLATSTGSPANISTSIKLEPPFFSPARSAVIVNALWFTSLSLSVAVSLVAILAKEWCQAFMSGRVGSMLRQGRLRQQRWDGIDRWKMKEVMSLLPLLMHTALLLFSIGLSLYLWDINMQVALPVMIIATFATLFYFISAILPLFCGFSVPYRTAFTMLLYPYSIPTAKIVLKGCRIAAWLLDMLAKPFNQFPYLRYDIDWAADRVDSWGKRMREDLSTDRFALIEQETPMDDVTSSMLGWMITNCEDSKSVDIALQALAGAGLDLPCESFWECGATELVARRLKFYLDALENPHTGHPGPEHNRLLDCACLYSRSMDFLIESIQGKTFRTPIHDAGRWGYTYAGDDRFDILQRLRSNLLLDHAFSGRTAQYYAITALELDSIFLRILQTWLRSDLEAAAHRGMEGRQQEVLERITTNKLTLPLTALLALVNALTKTYFYDPRQPPCLLVDLLNMITSESDKPALRHAIGISLTVAAFANYDFLGGETPTNRDETRLQRAHRVYRKLVLEKASPDKTRYLLIFGLFGLLTRHRYLENPCEAELKSISQALDSFTLSLDNPRPGHGFENRNSIPTLPWSFDLRDHFFQYLSSWLPASSENSVTPGRSLSAHYVSLILTTSFCSKFGKNSEKVIIPLCNNFTDQVHQPDELTRVCLLGYFNCASGEVMPEVIEKLMENGLVEQLLQRAMSTDARTAPLYMRFLWTTSVQLVPRVLYGNEYHQLGLRALRGSPVEEATPTNLGEMGSAEQWINELENMCHSDPQNVLDSGILSKMIQFYEEDDNRHATPQTTELPSRFSNKTRWLEILQTLEADCKTAVEPKFKPELEQRKMGDHPEQMGMGFEGEETGEPSDPAA